MKIDEMKEKNHNLRPQRFVQSRRFNWIHTIIINLDLETINAKISLLKNNQNTNNAYSFLLSFLNMVVR